MNLTHLRYAVEIAKAGSINKAAEKLYIGQPNLSRAVKELEASLGVNVFDRSAKGMELTSDGEIFIKYAENILNQIDTLKDIFKGEKQTKKRFSLAAPDSGYIMSAFSSLSAEIKSQTDAQLYFFKENDPSGVIKIVLRGDCTLGIIRYNQKYDKFYKSMMDEKEIDYELLGEFKKCVLISSRHPLATNESVCRRDLCWYTEICDLDPYSSPSFSQDIKDVQDKPIQRRVFSDSRSCRFLVLSQNPCSYLIEEPCPNSVLKRFGIVQKELADGDCIYKDVLIHRKDYRLGELDNDFISYLCEFKRKTFL